MMERCLREKAEEEGNQVSEKLRHVSRVKVFPAHIDEAKRLIISARCMIRNYKKAGDEDKLAEWIDRLADRQLDLDEKLAAWKASKK